MITITIETDNAALNDYEDELSRIFRNLSMDAEHGKMSQSSYEYVVRDSNGNTVGEVVVT